MLERSLRLYGTIRPVKHVYRWFDIVLLDSCRRVLHRPDSTQVIRSIRHWLEQHSDIHKQLIMEHLKRIHEFHGVHYSVNYQRFLHTNLPSDFGEWCLQQAVKYADFSPKLAEYLFVKVLELFQNGYSSEGLSQEKLVEFASKLGHQTPRDGNCNIRIFKRSPRPILGIRYRRNRQKIKKLYSKNNGWSPSVEILRNYPQVEAILLSYIQFLWHILD